jgi:UDP-N-acetyl-D-mannosaminuronate dehydrogenase
MKKTELENKTVAVVGLGYVGLPLAVEFGKRMTTIGYDLNEAKLASYRRYQDPTGGTGEDDLRAAGKLSYTSNRRIWRRRISLSWPFPRRWMTRISLISVRYIPLAS